MSYSKMKIWVVAFAIFSSISAFFTNCSPVSFSSETLSSTLPDLGSSGTNPNDGICASDPTNPKCTTNTGSCLFNGNSIADGQSVTAYLNSTGQCTSETRTCTKGTLSGSYNYATCSPTAPASCLFDGKTIAHGGTVEAYLSSSVAYGGTCGSETRTCTNGVLSGSYNYSSCGVGIAASCSFNGLTVPHGSSVKGYLNSSTAYGTTCASQDRICNNGSLSGSYQYASCTVSSAASCTFDGKTVANGETVFAFLTSSVAFGQTCQQQARNCNNGSLSGSYTFASCNVGTASSCTFNGQSVAHGGSVTAYQSSSVASGQTCVSQARSCNNGALSGSFSYGSCVVNQAAACSFNGQTIPSGGTVTAYAAPSVAFGSTCSSQTRVCTNGVLSGSNAYSTCATNAAQSCSLGGSTYSHGQTITAYSSSSGSSCSSIARTCNNGSWSGSSNYAYTSCSVTTAPCSLNGQSIPNGSSIITYATSSVAYGQSCASQTRYCSNGSLSGSYTNTSCSAQAAASCTAKQTELGCGSELTCPDGTVVGAQATSIMATINSVGHGQYSAITSTSQGSVTNVRFYCNNGNFEYSPTGATSCQASKTYLAASDARCKKNCTTGFASAIKCRVVEYCPAGTGRANSAITSSTQYPDGYFSVTGNMGQTVTISQNQVRIYDSSLTITRWDTYSATCDANGSGNWTQGTLGYGNCDLKKTVSASDPRCVFWDSGGGG